MGKVANLQPPEPLSEAHDRAGFNSGEPSLDEWLRRRARSNQASGASRTFVTCESNCVFGYYALGSGAIMLELAPGRFRRNMPSPIPVVVLGRLAVHRTRQGTGIGGALFRDAAMRVANAADAIGIRGIVVHAISDEARRFYLALGFEPSPHEPMTLLITLTDLRAALS